MDIHLPHNFTHDASPPRPNRHLKQLSLAASSSIITSPSSPRSNPPSSSSPVTRNPNKPHHSPYTFPPPASSPSASNSPSLLSRSNSTSSSASSTGPRTPVGLGRFQGSARTPLTNGQARRTSSISYASSPSREPSWDSTTTPGKNGALSFSSSNPYASTSSTPGRPSPIPLDRSSPYRSRLSVGSGDTVSEEGLLTGLGLAGLGDESGACAAAEDRSTEESTAGTPTRGTMPRTPLRSVSYGSGTPTTGGRDSPAPEGRDPESFMTLAEK